MECQLFFLRMVTLTGVCILTSMASASGMPLGLDSGCLDDNHCDPGFFCNTRTQACVSCEEIDCGKYLRLPGTSKCTRSKNECGPCIKGYKLIHGHCRPTEDNYTSFQPNNKLEEVNHEEAASISAASANSILIFGIVIVSLLLATMLGILLLCLYKKVKPSYTNDGKAYLQSSPIEYMEPPPPYNTSASTAPSLPLTECRRMMKQCLNQAIPFQPSLFMDDDVNFENIEYGENLQVVPEDPLVEDQDMFDMDLAQPQDIYFTPPQDISEQEVPEMMLQDDSETEFYNENSDPLEPNDADLPFQLDFQFDFEALVNLFFFNQQEVANLVAIPGVAVAPNLQLDEVFLQFEEENL